MSQLKYYNTDTEQWEPAIVGAQGPQGEEGPQGPEGPEGPVGPSGADGVDGISAYEVAIENGFVGTEEEWLESLVGPVGPEATPGPMNYAQTKATRQASVSANGATIVSASITTTGKAVQVMVTGDVENTAAGGWTKIALYRDSVQVGNAIHTEGSAASENNAYALTVIDTPAAGTYTYALKIVDNANAGGTFNWGESEGPVLTAVELAGPAGPAGPVGPAGPAGDPTLTINQQANTYTLLLSDASKLIEMSSSGNININVPTDANVNFPVGTQISILQTGTGQVTIAAATPATTTINGTPGLKLRVQWSAATLIKRGVNLWVVTGDLA